MDVIETTPQSEAMAGVRAALLALCGRTDDVGAQAAEAFFLLDMVHPPYAPAEVLPEAQTHTLEQVRELLVAAAHASADTLELGRIAEAGTALNTPIAR